LPHQPQSFIWKKKITASCKNSRYKFHGKIDSNKNTDEPFKWQAKRVEKSYFVDPSKENINGIKA